MIVERKDTQFRVVTQGFSTAWLEDTPSNRKAMVVLLRSLENESGEPLFTYDQLAQVLESPNRQAAHEHMQEFEGGGGDMLDFLARKRKVDGEVVTAVEAWHDFLPPPPSTKPFPNPHDATPSEAEKRFPLFSP